MYSYICVSMSRKRSEYLYSSLECMELRTDKIVLALCRWKHRSGVSLKVLVNCSHPDCAATASRILPLQGDDILKSDDLTRRICSVADAWSRKFILRCFSL